MKLPRRQFLHWVAGTAALPAVSRSALAQSYPTRPIIMIVPFPAGGPTDAIGRIIAEAMRPSLGQSVVVENVPGAAGSWAPSASRWRRRTVTRLASETRSRMS